MTQKLTQDLIRGFLEGKEEAGNEVIRILRPWLIGYLGRRGISGSESEDLANDVVEYLWRTRDPEQEKYFERRAWRRCRGRLLDYWRDVAHRAETALTEESPSEEAPLPEEFVQAAPDEPTDWKCFAAGELEKAYFLDLALLTYPQKRRETVRDAMYDNGGGRHER